MNYSNVIRAEAVGMARTSGRPVEGPRLRGYREGVPPRSPNIVLILSDDHGYADRSATGVHGDVATPALDRLAAQGVTCTQAYVTAPVCSPSRAGLISGQYQARWGSFWFDDSHFPDHLPSLAEALQGYGYATGYLGKVHYGPEQRGDRAAPPHHGFDTTFYGLAGQQSGRLNYLRHSRRAVRQYGQYAAARSAVQPMLEGDDEVDLEGFLTDELGKRARQFVSLHAGAGPFFLMLAFNAVHNFCWQLPPQELEARGLPTHADFTGGQQDYLQWYDGQVAPNLEHGREYYLAQLELMDRQVGLLLDTLDHCGVADDTVVIYLTDNGGSHCNFASNAPLRGTKYTLAEGGIRVPFLVRWPGGGVPAGVERHAMVSAMDLYPTLLAAAGADRWDAHHCDGVDILPLLCEGDTAASHQELHWDNGFQWAVRSGRWKLSWTDMDSAGVQGLRDVEHVDPIAGFGLFDLQEDPGEQVNLAECQPEVAAWLRDRHDLWRRTVVGTFETPTGTVPPTTGQGAGSRPGSQLHS